MADLTNEEFRKRVGDLLDEELKDPTPVRWLLSFADEHGFRGACCVHAPGFMSAVLVSKALGCNAGGQVVGWELSDADYPGMTMAALLSDEELKRYGLR